MRGEVNGLNATMRNMWTVEMEDLRGALARSEPVFILDVRPAYDAREWSIPGSTHVDAYEALTVGDPNALESVSVPPGRLAVTVCARGNTSLLAARQLRARGIDARSLNGGMKAWSLAWNTAEVPVADPSLEVVQVRRTGKGCLSYVVASNGEAAVIDAALPVEVYERIARERGWKIKAVLETHMHADHLVRGRELAGRNAATLYLPRVSSVTFEAVRVQEGTRIGLGDHGIVALHTPGHTLDSTSYRIGDELLFTGDTVFVDSVGRPDLGASLDGARRRAGMLFDSLKRIATLDGNLGVLPGHTSAPVPFDATPIMARLDDVRRDVEWFHLDERGFVERMLASLPPTPPNHDVIMRLNEGGLGSLVDAPDLEAGGNRCAAR